jgi:hypothetical protein
MSSFSSVTEALDLLVEPFERRGDWEQVLRRAQEPIGKPRQRRLRSRRLAVVVAVLIALLVLLATPAFGVQRYLLDLLDRHNVPFAHSRSAPNEIKKQFADLALGAPTQFAPRALAGQTRDVGTFLVGGRRRQLWVTPTRDGGYCYLFEGSGGGCRKARSDRRRKLSVSWMSGSPRSSLAEAIVARVAGDLTAPTAASLRTEYGDGTRAEIPFVWVSKPIAAGFFAYEIPATHRTAASRLVAVSLTDRKGRLLARQSFHFRPVPRPTPNPAHAATRPKGRSLPKHPDIPPSEPTQQGHADGFHVVVGHNGSVQFTQIGTTPILRRLTGQSAGFGCFRLTREFGIFTVRGLGQGGRFAAQVGFQLNGVGTPVDGCEVQASIGHRWPDPFGNHAAVEIPLSERGRAFFRDRATARDLALFVRTRRIQQIRKQPARTALATIQRLYGKQLVTHGISVRAYAPSMLVFSKASPTGKTFKVTVENGRIRKQNLRPYALVF